MLMGSGYHGLPVSQNYLRLHYQQSDHTTHITCFNYKYHCMDLIGKSKVHHTVVINNSINEANKSIEMHDYGDSN